MGTENSLTKDEYGRVLVDETNIIDILMNGHMIHDHVQFKPTADVIKHNQMCEDLSISPLYVVRNDFDSISDFHKYCTNEWLIPAHYLTIDVKSYILDMCETDIERDRVNLEYKMYEERNLIPLLQLVIFLVDHMRKNNIVWGVGRGSSVASYILFLIGIHKIDSIKYELDIEEFLK